MPRRPRRDPREYLREHFHLGPTWPEYEEQRKALWFTEEVRERLQREATEQALVDVAFASVSPEDRAEAVKRHLYELERLEVIYESCRSLFRGSMIPRDGDD